MLTSVPLNTFHNTAIVVEDALSIQTYSTLRCWITIISLSPTQQTKAYHLEMRRDTKSVKADTTNFQRVYNERIPAVLNASRALQAAMGVEPGTKMLGSHPVRLWEMPEPPEETLEEMSATWRKDWKKDLAALPLPGKPAQKPPGEPVEESDDEDDEEEDSQSDSELLCHPGDYAEVSDDAMYDCIDFGDDTQNEVQSGGDAPMRVSLLEEQTTAPDPAELKRKWQNSPVTKPQRGDAKGSKKLRVVVDLTDSPNLDNSVHHTPRQGPFQPAVVRPNSSSNLAVIKSPEQNNLPHPPLNNPPNTDSEENPPSNAASPPPRWLTLPNSIDAHRHPCYWSRLLAKHIKRWLIQAGTKSSQSTLTHLTLRRLPGPGDKKAAVYMNIDARDYAKVKLTRLTLPESAQPKEMREWVVLEVDYCKDSALPPTRPGEAGSDSSDEDAYTKRRFKPSMMGFFAGLPPFWLIAFPLQAITHTQIQQKRDPASLLSPARPQGRKTGKKARAEAEKQQSMQSFTTLFLGKEGRVPVVQARGLEEKFADEFVRACAVGKAVVEVRSAEGVKL